MPTVPTYERQEQISRLPTVRSTASTTPETFGAGIGRALQGVGNQVVDFAQQEQEKQDMAALMSAERSLQQWQNQALFTPETGAFAQRGQNAFGLPDKLMPEWDKQVGQVESTLNDRQRAKLRERAGGMRVSMERDLMRHVGGEAESFQKAETNALVTTRLETAMLYSSDPARFDKELREAQGVFMAGNPGLPPAALQLGVNEIESKARASVVTKMIDDDPLGAQRYFDTYTDKMTAADRAQAERLLRPAWTDAEGRRALRQAKVGASTSAWVGKTGDASAIQSSADELGIDAVDLATVISYETGGTFDPDKAGPTTRWGQHRGLIQFGEPQRLKYGVKPGQSVPEQMKAVVAYLKDAGVKPGMGIMDVYSAINAGAPGRYNASDEAAGGAPGTVADKVKNQMGAHRQKAEAMFSPAAREALESGASAAAVPQSKAEVLALLNNIPNPHIRQSAIGAYKAELEIQKIAEDDAEQAFTESINEKVEAADPTTPLRRVLSSQEYAWATEKGKIASWEARMNQRLQGLEPKTDPNLFDALQGTLVRAENGDATALAEVKKMDVSRMFTGLDRQARDYIQNRRGAILGEGKKKDDLPDFASEDELLNVEVFDKLGITKTPNKDESEENKSTRVQFMQSYWAAIEQAQTEKGKKLTATEKQQIMRDQLLPFSRTVRDKYVGFIDSEETRRGFEIGTVPVLDRQQITDAYKRVHGVTPTDSQIRAAYLRAQGYAPKMETE